MSRIAVESQAAKWRDTSWTVAFCTPSEHLTTIIWDCETPALRSLRPPTSTFWATVCHLSFKAVFFSIFFFFFFCVCCGATVEINRYLWLSQPRLLKYWRTKRDWLSEVERLGQSWLIRQTKCYFCFLCGWGEREKERGWGGLLSHYQCYLSSPCQPPYYSTFLSGADSSLTPCFPHNAQHLSLQLFPVSYLIRHLCVCMMFVYKRSQCNCPTPTRCSAGIKKKKTATRAQYETCTCSIETERFGLILKLEMYLRSP